MRDLARLGFGWPLWTKKVFQYQAGGSAFVKALKAEALRLSGRARR